MWMADAALLCAESVHFQHSAHLLTALTAAGVDYRVQLYPDSPHSVLDVLSSSFSVAGGPFTSQAQARAPAASATTSVRRHVLRTFQAFLHSRCRTL